MLTALEEAKSAQDRDEVPIGAIIIDENDVIIARAGNRTRENHDPCAHAEILAIQAACKKKGAQRIPETILYVTLEPCAMCAAAISFARIKRVIIGTLDPKGGGVLHGGKFYEQQTCHHKPDVHHDLLQEDCAKILKDFFKRKR